MISERMKIDIELRPLDELPKNIQSKICKCRERCESYMFLDGYGRFCENDSLIIAKQMFSIITGIRKPKPGNPAQDGWTISQEQVIIDWYRSKDRIRWGDRRIIANMLGKNYTAVSSKIDRMKREGKI